jgi:hypothetical protein
LPTLLQSAPVAELVDALDSKSCIFGCAGSIPARGTKKQCEKQSESDVGNTAFFSSFCFSICFTYFLIGGKCILVLSSE